MPWAHSTLHLRGDFMSVDRCGTAWAGHSTRCAAFTAATFGAWRHSVTQRAERHRSITLAPYPKQAICIRSTCAWETLGQSRAAGWHSKPWDARLFDLVYDTETTMQQALRYDFAALLQQGSGVQLPHYGGVDSYLEHCCLSGFPSVQIMLSRLGCTEQPGSPALSRPTPAVVQAMEDEYLGSHPYYK